MVYPLSATFKTRRGDPWFCKLLDAHMWSSLGPRLWSDKRLASLVTSMARAGINPACITGARRVKADQTQLPIRLRSSSARGLQFIPKRLLQPGLQCRIVSNELSPSAERFAAAA